MVQQVSIMLPLPGSDQWMELCRCEGPRSVIEIIRVLLDAPKNPPLVIKLEVRQE